MRKLNEVFWSQLSMWDFPPENCIEKYTKEGDHTFHYVLKEVYEVSSDSSYKTRYPTSPDKLAYYLEIDQIFVRNNGTRTSVDLKN